jgi:KipI family sensor histidine kinase inhibitor
MAAKSSAMSFNFNTEISVIAEDMLELHLHDFHSNKSKFYWHLAEHLLQSQNDIEVIASEEVISIRSKVIPMDIKKIEATLSSFEFSLISQIDHKLEIPICYEEVFASDLKEISKQLNLTTQEIIDIHSSAAYEVKAIGFTPGFSYLGDLDEKIAVPRLSKPRVKTMVGSVAIANDRTGIYCLGGPGGWPIIGATPMNLFNPDDDGSVTLIPGTKVTFKKISMEEFKIVESRN